MLSWRIFRPPSLKRVLALLLLVVAFVWPAAAASASTIGVGVGKGRITLNQPLKPGLTYSLPSISVFNNGDVASTYEMSVQYNQTQPELKPTSSWLKFSPQRFDLQPGKAQVVSITIKTDSSTRPGKYFAYLEAHPLKKDVHGLTAINIAAATKFSFSVAPANFLQKLYYILLDFWNLHKPILLFILILLALLIISLLNRFIFHIEVRRQRHYRSR